MLYISIIILILSTFISLAFYKKILSPAVLQPIPWIISLSILPFTKFYFSPNHWLYLYLALGTIIFQVGYFISSNKRIIKSDFNSFKQIYHPKFKIIKIIIYLEIIFITFLYLKISQYVIGNYTTSIFITLKTGYATNSFNLPAIFSYIKSFISIFTIFMVIISFYINPYFKNKYKTLLVIQLFILFASLLSNLTRNDVLSVFLPILVSIIVIKNFNNKTVFKYLFRFVIMFMIFFIVFASFKYYNSFESSTLFSFTAKQISGYLSGSISALESFVSSRIVMIHGQNTFRFFIAIYDSIFNDNLAVPLVQNYTFIGDDIVTNVYTFYHYYIYDFGLIYALFIQFLIGVFYGYIYKKSSSKKPYYVFIFSVFMYPLLMQFFQDQYFSLFSGWVQFIVIGYILFKTDFILTKTVIINSKI